MKRPAFLLPLVIASLACLASRGAESLVRREWTVEGVTREALVYVPAQAATNPSPLVFAFHGHGGTMRIAARRFGFHTVWPEAIVVYPQGLNTPGLLTDPEGKRAGWQVRPGTQGDRDLKFFDAMLATLEKEFRVDRKRVYATGHSNGGAFTYLLWASRGDVLAAFGPVAATTPPANLPRLKPRPLLHVAGQKDPLVKFDWQQRTIEVCRKLNQCAEGQDWAKNCTLYPSKAGAPVVAFIHPGGHEYPPGASEAIVRFFKTNPLPRRSE